jgi:tRNA G18 (ribose-2'-O)-methylase SpoU
VLQRPFKPKDAGSIPAAPTMELKLNQKIHLRFSKEKIETAVVVENNGQSYRVLWLSGPWSGRKTYYGKQHIFSQLKKEEKNVCDEMKTFSVDEIAEFCHNNAYKNTAVLMSHVVGDFNLSGLIRSANALGFEKVFYVGKKKWDRRGAVGTHNYTPVNFFSTFESAIESLKEKYTFVALENNVAGFDVENIYHFEWPKNPLILVGEEKNGLPLEILKQCSHIVTIPQKGSVRSMNVSVAASIAMAMFAEQIEREK